MERPYKVQVVLHGWEKIGPIATLHSNFNIILSVENPKDFALKFQGPDITFAMESNCIVFFMSLVVVRRSKGGPTNVAQNKP